MFKNITNCQYGYSNRISTYQSIRDSKEAVQRFKLLKELDVHNGCVNTISWNDSGQYILSGSDDIHLCITNANTYRKKALIRTGHRNNIFSAKFLPCTNDREIISCSGDGIIIFTNLDSPFITGINRFTCHFGTAYELRVIPNDPFSFLSCGEDGTVRFFDLRSKTGCLKDNCKEDILINCRRAVTSMCLNPSVPYQLAVGCADSTIRIYDRRMLGTPSTGYSIRDCTRGMLNCSTIPTSESRTHRITSLCYNDVGSELLVSYSAENVYLYKLKDEKFVVYSSNKNGKTATGHFGPISSAPPMKRLRVRGDWSDTGPNARPESEASTANQESQQRRPFRSTLIQRMSDVLTRMFNDPSRSSRNRSQQRPDETRPSTETGQEQLADQEERVALPLNEESRVEPSISEGGEIANVEHPSTEAAMTEESTANDSGVTSKSDMPSTSGNSTVGAVSSPKDLDVEAVQESQKSESVPDELNSEKLETSEIDEMPAEGAACSVVVPEIEMCTLVESDCLTANEIKPLESTSAQGQTDNEKETAGDESSGEVLMKEGFQSIETNLRSLRQDFIEKNKMEPVVNLHYDAQGVSSGVISMDVADTMDRKHVGQTKDSKQTSSHNIPDSDSISHATCDKSEPCGTTQGSSSVEPSTSHESGDTNNQRISDDSDESSAGAPVSHPSEQATSSNVVLSEHGSSNISANSSLHEISMESNSENDEEISSEEELDDEFMTAMHDRIVSTTREDLTIDSALDSPEEESEKSREQMEKEEEATMESLPHYTAYKKFQGHRNARTMIKEVNFWGENYIVSGSDCGHVFFWDKETAEVVMLLEADRHVVNCVQPHPYDPILATSGIDYDVKLWAPIGEEAFFDSKRATEIIRRNKVMLGESLDTITVPASFMIRMLASLNHIRSAGGLAAARNRARRQAEEQNENS